MKGFSHLSCWTILWRIVTFSLNNIPVRVFVLYIKAGATRVQKKFMFKQVFESGENYGGQIRLSFLETVLEITFFGQFIEAK